ncbi:MAG: hypothetical protein PQJ58_19635 [Spirochaetales bacterium]|nr:hypothetical protein [Spirochaetales bacterium]
MGIEAKRLDNKGFIIRYTDILNGSDLISHMEQAYSNPDLLRDSDFGLNDFSNVVKLNITSDQIAEIARLNRKIHRDHDSRFRIVIYSPAELFSFMSKLWKDYLGSAGSSVFHTKSLDEASSWLSNELGRDIILA